MNEMILGGRRVGIAQKPLVVAEIGINHGGDLAEAYKLVDAAALAGVEVIKHQTHVIEDEMSASAKSVIPGNATESIYAIMSRCALNEEEEGLLKSYVENRGMIFISTPFSRAAADRLERLGVVGYKIGSGECNNYPLIRYVASFGKPIILSTGMNTLASVSKAVEILEKSGVQYALLHTTNLYPTPPHLVRLGAMVELQNKFPNAIVGLSDHTQNNLACFGAVALGASILERHFTDSMQREGPDIVCSMDISACRELIHGAEILALERGGRKGCIDEEQVTMKFAFATVVSIATIQEGEILSESNIWVKRPGTGEIPAEYFENLIGRRASRMIPSDTHLTYSDIS